MRDLGRPLLLVAAALAVPIVPFLIWGARIEGAVADWARETSGGPLAAVLLAAVLAGDVFLPVPSSLVTTLGGAKLGFLTGTLVSWLGMSAGAWLGFSAAKRWGTPLAHRLASEAELNRIAALAERFGPQTLVLTRPLPVLAEAALLLLGASKVPWRRVAIPIALSNLGIAAAYSAAGRFALQQDALPLAMLLSVALPLAATVVMRWRWR